MRRSFIRIAQACLIIAVPFATAQVRAACTAPNNVSVSIGHIPIPPDTEIGGLVHEVDVPDVVFHCNPALTARYGIQFGPVAQSGIGIGGPYHDPRYPQLGFVVKSRDSDWQMSSRYGHFMIPAGGLADPSIITVRLKYQFFYRGGNPPANPPTNPPMDRMRFRLVPCVQVSSGSTACGGGTEQALVLVTPTGATIEKTTCLLEHRSITLDDVQPSELAQVDNAAQRKSFNVRMSCGAGIARHTRFTIADATDGTNTGDKLVNAAGSTATGVRMQLLRSGTPLSMKSSWDDIVTPEGTRDIPLQAQYIRVNEPLRPGTLQGVATLTITYP